MVRLKGDETCSPLVGLVTTVWASAAGNENVASVRRGRNLKSFIEKTFAKKNWRRLGRPNTCLSHPTQSCLGSERWADLADCRLIREFPANAHTRASSTSNTICRLDSRSVQEAKARLSARTPETPGSAPSPLPITPRERF
jgi:hypothetical protein